MEFQVQSDDEGRITLYCPEKMEWRAREDFAEQVRQQTADREVSGVVLDLGNVTFVNSAGIGAIFTLHQYAQERQAPMVVARPRPAVLRLLKTVNLPELIPIAKNLDDANRLLDQKQDES
ncbi:MAG: STAS domain-containing protein [Phycisphaerae bacterium]